MSKKPLLYKYIPLFDWIRNYDKSDLSGDLVAGITVGVMLIPQSMAYAVLAGLPPVYGLYASVFPMIIYGILGTSRELAVGPAAIICILIVAGVSEFAEVGSDRFIQLAILTAFGVGILQLAMGLLKMGFIVNFLSHPVNSGFISASALIIAVSQLESLLGLDLEKSTKVYETVAEVALRIGDIHPATAIMGILSLIFLISFKFWKKRFPAALVVVAAGIIFTWLFNLESMGVSIVGSIPEGMPSLNATFISIADLQQLIPLILIISLVAYVQSIAIAKLMASKKGYRIDTNQELIALGAANIGGALFQAFPTTGGFSKTAVNEQSGGKSGISAITTAVLIGLTLLFLTPLFYYLPNAILAAIIISAVVGLFDLRRMVYLWRADKRDLIMLLITFFATLIIGIEEGIAIGVVISVIAVVYSTTRPPTAELGRLGNTRNFRNVNRYHTATTWEDILVYRFDSALYFANVEYFQDSLENLVQEKGEENLNLVILDARSINSIDSTGVHILKFIIKGLRDREIDIYIAGAIGPVSKMLKKTEIVDMIGEDHFFFDVPSAVQQYRSGESSATSHDYSPLYSDD
ncbi:MAG TPA: sulfate permease [Balneolaceae bacterium]|nr:sulfate permease [Balneolaceae bacterium]